MLFDIRGKRKRFIQAIYLFLALLLGGGLVVFGIGGDAPGGLGDALGIGSSQSGSGGDSGFDEEIEQAEQALEQNPDNAAALASLARYQFLAGQAQLDTDDEGFEVLTEDAISRYEASIDAWERYLEARKGKPDESVATLVSQAYSNLAFVRQDPVLIQRTLDGAVRTAAIVAEANPNPNSLLQLARLAYFAGKTNEAERAREEALASVEDKSSRSSLETQLDAVKRQGRAIQAQLEAGAPGQEDFENPLGNLGAEGGGGQSG